MTRTFRILAAAVAVALSLAGASFADEVTSLRPIPVPATNQAPPIFPIKEGTIPDKAYRQQPPLIPHRVDKVEVDLKVNQCLRCHDWPYNTQEGAPKVSETHYVDRQGTRLDQIAGNRWFCQQCHVPQADAPPLVGNSFRPAVNPTSPR